LIRIDSKDCNFHFKDLSCKYLHFFDRFKRSILSQSFINQAPTLRFLTHKLISTTILMRPFFGSSGTTSTHTTSKRYNQKKWDDSNTFNLSSTKIIWILRPALVLITPFSSKAQIFSMRWMKFWIPLTCKNSVMNLRMTLKVHYG
jgi:hypothetical protein